jgi:hypothetical protein
MPENYVLLERTELNASAASVTFANIPQTGYTDLKIVVSARGSSAGINAAIYWTFNGSSAANYSWRQLQGNSSTASSSSSTGQTYFRAGYVPDTSATASTFGSAELYIPNYAESTAKSISIDSAQENNSGTAGEALLHLVAASWSLTNAITSITAVLSSGDFLTGSTFSLYGIAALGTTPAIAPKADGGNVIATDGTYWYHAFLSSGSFVPQVALSCDVLVVAGGAGGGHWSGGGGGAGGLVYSSGQSVATSTIYACVIGAGGAFGISTANGANGASSSFNSIIASGGGGGASDLGTGSNNGVAGASGGGANGGYNNQGGAATPAGQGFPGSGGATGAPNPGGGGGGSAEAGGTDLQGYGGDGLSTYSSWGLATTTGQNISGTVYYAGGGGGGTGAGSTLKLGGDGGGGNGGYGYGGTVLNPTAGTANTGGGGGGGTSVANGAAGGSGIVIIRYTIA